MNGCQPEIVTITEDLIKAVTDGAGNWIAQRKAFGSRISREHEARIDGIPDFRQHQRGANADSTRQAKGGSGSGEEDQEAET